MLAIALIAMIFGAVVLASLLLFASTALESSGRLGENLQAYYAADAGAEDAIWKVRYGDLSAAGVGAPGDSTIYTLPLPINDFTVTVRISRFRTDIAMEDFETGGSGGGTGWLSGWTFTGDASVVTADGPYQGSNHLRLRGSTGYAKRAVNLSGLSGLRLRFWAKVDSFEAGDTATLRLGPAGNPTTVKTWTSADADNIYNSYDIDLSLYAMAGDFRIVYQANMGGADDRFFVDDIQIVYPVPGVLHGLPLEDFESGGLSGGYGWLDPWSLSGDASVANTGGPHSGFYHLMLKRGNGVARRQASLITFSNLRAQFWSQASSFEAGETAKFQVSLNGATWTTVKTWTAADSDNTYHFNDIDLSPYTLSNDFWFRFDSNMGDTDDFFYVDDFRVVGPTAYDILSNASTFPLRALVLVRGTQVVVLSWKVG